MDATVSFLDRLIVGGLLIPTGVDGLYGRSERFERIVEALEALVTREGRADGAERVRFPPAMPREQFARGDYMRSFPHLAGSIHCFCGDERAHRALLRRIEGGEDWSGDQTPSELVLTPAACYPVYPMLAARGPLKPNGALFDVMSWCFRHEPSLQPTRMQMFRMREYVRIASPEVIEAFREDWMTRATRMIEALALPFSIEIASDPFFGRSGKLLANNQRAQQLKFELLIPVNADADPTACISFNNHRDHFGEIWDITQADGARAHSGCVGFGLERLALALLRRHGFDPADWPASARATLWP